MTRNSNPDNPGTRKLDSSQEINTAGRPGSPEIRPASHGAACNSRRAFTPLSWIEAVRKEVASLLWESARKREPWAIQAVLQRLAPESKQIKMTHGLQNETNIDYTRLSGAELDQIQRLLERARVPTGTGEDGESAPQPEGIRD